MRKSIGQPALSLLQPQCALGFVRPGGRHPTELEMGAIQHAIPGQRCRHHARPQRHDEVRQHFGGLPLVRGDPRVEVGKRGLEQRLPDVGPQFVLRILPGSLGPDLLPAKEQSTAAVFPDFPAPIPELDDGPVPQPDGLAIRHIQSLQFVRQSRAG